MLNILNITHVLLLCMACSPRNRPDCPSIVALHSSPHISKRQRAPYDSSHARKHKREFQQSEPARQQQQPARRQTCIRNISQDFTLPRQTSSCKYYVAILTISCRCVRRDQAGPAIRNVRCISQREALRRVDYVMTGVTANTALQRWSNLAEQEQWRFATVP